ncbi:MAG: hypothetical protein II937_05480 [Bacteroidales bacterium]|nr:hypothetical protein [Bacteroidales bacterium]
MEVVYVIFGIICVIFFCKCWSMTNDVRKIKNKILKEELIETNISTQYAVDSLRQKLLSGNIEYVKQRLLNNFYYEVKKSFDTLPKTPNKEEALKQSIRPLIEKLHKQFDKIGEEMPNFIKKMETYDDYYNVFTIKDFK